VLGCSDSGCGIHENRATNTTTDLNIEFWNLVYLIMPFQLHKSFGVEWYEGMNGELGTMWKKELCLDLTLRRLILIGTAHWDALRTSLGTQCTSTWKESVNMAQERSHSLIVRIIRNTRVYYIYKWQTSSINLDQWYTNQCLWRVKENFLISVWRNCWKDTKPHRTACP
jgi:hypothetical protein